MSKQGFYVVQALMSPSPRVSVIIIVEGYNIATGIQESLKLTVFLSGSLEEDEAREILAEFLLCNLLAVPPLVK